MIEVEKKFILTDEQEKNLTSGAEFLGEKSFTDTYYDYPDYSLTTKDIWLRNRDGKFELKIPMNVSIEERVSDQYKEVENDIEIAEFLKAPAGKSLADFLKDSDCNPFCSLTTTRKKYRKDGYSLDLDIVDFGYNVSEIEYMIEDESKIKEASEKIIEYARGYGLSESIVRGKVAEYLRRNNPEHFQVLIKAKVIK